MLSKWHRRCYLFRKRFVAKYVKHPFKRRTDMSQTGCECRSPQEQRLLDKIEGKVDRFRATHERVFRMLERFDGMKPRIDIERALYFTQSMQETEGQPLVLRWAKALMHIAQNITVYVQDDQLLLGRAGCDGRYGIL